MHLNIILFVGSNQATKDPTAFGDRIHDYKRILFLSTFDYIIHIHIACYMVSQRCYKNIIQ